MGGLRAGKTCDASLVCAPGAVTLLYCASGEGAVRCGASEVRLAAGETALVEHNDGGETVTLSAAGEAVVYAAQVW